MAALNTSIPSNVGPKMSENQNTNGSDYVVDSSSLIVTLLPAYIQTISMLGIVFNVFVLMVFCLHKKSCTVAEIYLSNLAGADLILVCCLPFWADYVINEYIWPFGEGMCKLVPAFIAMNACCSIYFLVMVSIVRYVALVHPLSHERMRRPFYAKLACLLVWGLGLIFALPIFIYRTLMPTASTTYPNASRCVLNCTTNQYIGSEVMTITLTFIIPVSIIFFCTLRIIQALIKKLPDGLNTQKMEQNPTTLIFAVLLAFLICWVPFHVTKIIDVLREVNILKHHNIYFIFQQISVYLAFFNSVLNPILYVIVGKNFRKRAKELFKL